MAAQITYLQFLKLQPLNNILSIDMGTTSPCTLIDPFALESDLLGG
jgi:hypothetical protein